MKKLIQKIRRILGISEIQNELGELHRSFNQSRLSKIHSDADLARLMVDLHCNKISMNSYDFICRMNLDLDNIKKRIPLDLCQTNNTKSQK